MKSFTILVSVVLMSLQANAEPGLGSKVEALVNGGRPALGVFSAETGLAAINVSFRGADFSKGGPVRNISGRLFNKQTQSYIGAWKTLEDSPGGVYYPGTMAFEFDLNGDEPNAILAAKSLKSLVMVFSVNRPKTDLQPTHYLDLSSYCVSNPDSFVNLATGKAGC